MVPIDGRTPDEISRRGDWLRRPRFVPALAAAVLVAFVVLVASACGDDDESRMMDAGGGSTTGMMGGSQPAGSIRVDLLNWEVKPAQASTKAGNVTFWAIHGMEHAHAASEGGNTHDLQVMRKRADGSMELVGQVQGIGMGQARELSLNLTPGKYELSCNVVEQVGGKMVAHYAKGMRVEFTVTA